MEGSRIGRRGIVSKRSSDSWLLVKPRALGDSSDTARRIALCKGVKKVHLTSGEYAYMVQTESSEEEQLLQIKKRVVKSAGRMQVSEIVQHSTYKAV